MSGSLSPAVIAPFTDGPPIAPVWASGTPFEAPVPLFTPNTPHMIGSAALSTGQLLTPAGDSVVVVPAPGPYQFILLIRCIFVYAPSSVAFAGVPSAFWYGTQQNPYVPALQASFSDQGLFFGTGRPPVAADLVRGFPVIGGQNANGVVLSSQQQRAVAGLPLLWGGGGFTAGNGTGALEFLYSIQTL